MFETISEKQKRVFDFYKKYIEDNWVSPTYSEAGLALNLSPSVVFSHVDNLEKKWYLRKNWNGGVFLTVSKTKKIPLLWTIACWEPIEVSEYIEDEIEVPDSMVWGWGAYYGLKARGYSMKDVWIFDWDLLIIRLQNTVNDWDIAVAILSDWFEEKATLKQIFKTPSSILLKAKNPAFDPICVWDCEIRGKLIWVIRQF